MLEEMAAQSGKYEEEVRQNIYLVLGVDKVGRVLEFLVGLAGRFNLSFSFKGILS